MLWRGGKGAHADRAWRCLLGLALAGSVCAVHSRALAEEPVSIWYRSSEGCPDGSDFVERLEARGKAARIATAGDRVDFVVTLGVDDSGSRGRLERQTSDGIVAIRQVEGTSCEEVAEALAFSLALADRGRPSAEPDADTEIEPPGGEPAPPEQLVPSPAPPPDVSSTRPRAAQSRAPRKGVERFALGLFGTGRTAVAPRGAWGAMLRFEFERGPGLGWQADLGAALGTGDRARGKLSVKLYSARFGVCPLWLNSGSLNLAWCGGIEGGLVRVDSEGPGSVGDEGSWFSLNVAEKLSWSVSKSWALAADMGAFVPFTRYSILAKNPEAVLHEVPPVGWTLGLGAIVHLN